MQIKWPDNSEFIRKYYCLLPLIAAKFSLQNKLLYLYWYLQYGAETWIHAISEGKQLTSSSKDKMREAGAGWEKSKEEI